MSFMTMNTCKMLEPLQHNGKESKKVAVCTVHALAALLRASLDPVRT